MLSAGRRTYDAVVRDVSSGSKSSYGSLGMEEISVVGGIDPNGTSRYT